MPPLGSRAWSPSATQQRPVGPTRAARRPGSGERGRLAWLIWIASAVVATCLILWLNRGTSFFNDEIIWFADVTDHEQWWSFLIPHNGHLHGTTRLVFEFVIPTMGPDYVIFRVLGVVAVVLTSGLFLKWSMRRVEPLVALAPAILLLVYGSAWQHVVGPIGFTVLIAISCGIGALLCLERGDRLGDFLACLLASLSAFTFTIGLAFLVAVAVSVLTRDDRLRRLWIFLVPLLLYAIWFAWAAKYGEGRTDAGNIAEIPQFFGRSLAINAGDLTGLNTITARVIGEDAPIQVSPANALGWIAAGALVVALGLRILRGSVPRSLWVSLAALATFWLSASLADRDPTLVDQARYIYPGSILLLMVAVDAIDGIKLPRPAIAVVATVFAFSLAMNLINLRAGGAYVRDWSEQRATQLAMLELADGLDPGSETTAGPAPTPPDALADDTTFLNRGGDDIDLGPERNPYLEAAQRFGSPARTLDEVRRSSPASRLLADNALLQLYGYFPVPIERPESAERCRRLRTGATIELPAEGAAVAAVGGTPVTPRIWRFADPPGAALAPVEPGKWNQIPLLPDSASEPWVISAPDGPLRVCAAGNLQPGTVTR